MVRHAVFFWLIDPRNVRWIDTRYWCDEVVPNKRNFENVRQNIGLFARVSAKLPQWEMVTLVRMHHREHR